MIAAFFGAALFCLLMAMLLAPLEALGWWAGWYGDDLDEPHDDSPAPYGRRRDPTDARHFVVFLDGIAKGGSDTFDEVQALLDRLDEAYPQVAVLGDIMPYSVTNTELTDHRPLSHFWRFALRQKLDGSNPLIGFSINMRNVFQVLVAADRRYGPLYSRAEAQVILNSLLRSGFRPGSGMYVTLIGYSGGGQIALGSTFALKRFLRAPISLVSLGGVLASDPGLEHLDHLYRLGGSLDPIPTIGRLLFPGRWPLLFNSHWNRLKRRRRITTIAMGPMGHTGPGGYLDAESFLPDGISFLDHTAATIGKILEEIDQRLQPEPGVLQLSEHPGGAEAGS